jgi:Xaa-Pro aminopeptidase
LYACVQVPIPEADRLHERWLGFETLTLIPFDAALIETTMLSLAELTWLNAYHQQVLQTLAPQLDGGLQVWLRQKCALLE